MGRSMGRFIPRTIDTGRCLLGLTAYFEGMALYWICIYHSDTAIGIGIPWWFIGFSLGE